MPIFGSRSMKNLRTVHPILQGLFDTVILSYDCTIIQGRRSRALQEKYFREGKTKLHWPYSKHNVRHPEDLALAVDVAPYIRGKGIIWDKYQCYHFAGYVLRISHEMKISVRWGGDWDRDQDVNDQNFRDLIHWELTSGRSE